MAELLACFLTGKHTRLLERFKQFKQRESRLTRSRDAVKKEIISQLDFRENE